MNLTPWAADKTILATPIQQVSEELVRQAVLNACTDTSPGYGDWMVERVIPRIHNSAPCDILVFDDKPVGWVGFTPYANEVLTWESSTFLAPSMRGVGMLAKARCRQAHMAEQLVEDCGPEAKLVSSIAEWNRRSQKAAQKYAKTHSWPDLGKLVEEPHKDRKSLLIVWPQPVPHQCFLGQE